MILSSLKLDLAAWDLTVDGLGNIASHSSATPELAAGAVAQDVASIVRTVQGELYYATDQGIPYFASFLGSNYSPQLFQAFAAQAALSVPGVVQVQVELDPVSSSRLLVGSVRVIDENGQQSNAHF